MKLIDILNLIAKGELEEGTKIKHNDIVFTYEKSCLMTEFGGKVRPIGFGVDELNGEVEIIGHDTNVAAKFNCEALDCENLKEVDADFMFEELGYEKKEDEECITYESEENDSIVLCKNLEVFYSADCYEGAQNINMAELKAINKKCQELGWE